MCKLEIKCVSEGSFCLRNPEHCDGLAHKERHEHKQTQFCNEDVSRRRFADSLGSHCAVLLALHKRCFNTKLTSRWQHKQHFRAANTHK